MTSYSEKYNALDDESKECLYEAIDRRMCGKSHIADILINDSDFEKYQFYIEVWKFSPRTGRGWSTNGYAKRKKMAIGL